ncbi:hypothetical protein [Saccharopolyspora taberi]|uniref:Uncharacterized protein n=1 Tax=Saccharopolyspora taberi TaxID=60895 RepID=A0ABN3V162_9PSEU
MNENTNETLDNILEEGAARVIEERWLSIDDLEGEVKQAAEAAYSAYDAWQKAAQTLQQAAEAAMS